MTNNEDWAKATFDFPGVTTLEQWAYVRCLSMEEAAVQLLQYPFPDAVPLGMIGEATKILESGP